MLLYRHVQGVPECAHRPRRDGGGDAHRVQRTRRAGQPQEAFKTAKLFLLIIPIGGAVAGIILIACYPLTIMFFDNISQEALDLSKQVILLLGCMMFLKLFNMTTMFGILRSGGDTSYIFLIDLVTMWGVGVPLAIFTAFILEWPLILVLGMLVAEETVKMLWSL